MKKKIFGHVFVIYLNVLGLGLGIIANNWFLIAWTTVWGVLSINSLISLFKEEDKDL